MKINRITITGADDKTSLQDLVDLSVQFPFVEWGILFSLSRAGTNRYPSIKWIKGIGEVEPGTVNLSAHLCGIYPRDILQKNNFDVVVRTYVNNYFQRAQINFNFSNTEWKSEYLLKLLKDTETQYILQANKSNAVVIEAIKETENFDILYDSSGGRGTEIKEIKPPFEKHYTGYSGGLNPDNIEAFCQQIIDYPSATSVFIDCESGVRDDKDEFDLNKVRKYLEICQKYIS
jgi:phosphoribosylanthranilate isomerase